MTNLDMHLSSPTAKIDVIAVVSGSSNEARRAKNGPRDWYTIFHITDPAHLEQEQAKLSLSAASGVDGLGEAGDRGASAKRPLRQDIRVEVFRPWKASLPVVDNGDVVLLRDFGVRSREHRTFLLSGDESAWCAFRPPHTVTAPDGEAGNGVVKPAWASGKVGVLREGLREEVRGPPVEVGPEERDRVVELRGWWDVVVMMHDKGKKRATL